jgi:hypothetical protein
MSTTEDAQARLDAIRAERAALAEAAAARLEPTVEEQIAAEERGLADDKRFAELQQEYGARSVKLIRTSAGAIVVRRPHIAAFRKFQDTGNLNSDATEEFVKSCLLHPSKPEFDKFMREQPGALVKIASVCVELAGFRSEELGKK